MSTTHFKKRKSRTSSVSSSLSSSASSLSSGAKRSIVANAPTGFESITATAATAVKAPAPTTEGASLAMALNALKVSLKREFDSFIPPTPCGSPVHSRAFMAKRPRLEVASAVALAFGENDDAATENCASLLNQSVPPSNATPVKAQSTALFSVNARIKMELEKRKKARREAERLQRARKRKQLNYFAIFGAFQRAAGERACVAIEASPSDA